MRDLSKHDFDTALEICGSRSEEGLQQLTLADRIVRAKSSQIREAATGWEIVSCGLHWLSDLNLKCPLTGKQGVLLLRYDCFEAFEPNWVVR